MAWNPSPEVAAARDFGKKFNYNKVYIIGVDEFTGRVEIISYGLNKKHCSEAKKCADKIFDDIINGKIKISE